MTNTPPPPPPGNQPPPGYQAYQGAATTSAGVPAEFGERFVAWLIDFVIVIPILIVSAIAFAVSEPLGLIVYIVGVLGYVIYNLMYLQGTTGQTIGKKRQNIKLVADATGQPVGFGMAFVRYIVAQLISSLTCGIGGVLDYLWPLWDAENKRLTDKVLKFGVVRA